MPYLRDVLAVAGNGAGRLDQERDRGSVDAWADRLSMPRTSAPVAALGRVAVPEDIADVVAFLACSDAGWTTGAFVDATGGSLFG